MGAIKKRRIIIDVVCDEEVTIGDLLKFVMGRVSVWPIAPHIEAVEVKDRKP